MRKLRTVSVFMALVGLALILISPFVEIDIIEWEEGWALVAAAFVSLGILTDTSKMPDPLSVQSILEKLKSPSALTSIVALFGFLLFKFTDPDIATSVMTVITAIIGAYTGFNIYQSPNQRDTLR